MTNEDIHKIKISGPVINFDIEVGSVTAAQVFTGLKKLLTDNLESLPRLNNSGVGSSFLPKTPTVSPQEFIIDVNAKTNPEKILAFAKYLSNGESETINPSSIRDLFQRAREPMPANFKRDFDVAVRNRWLDDNNGLYYVTGTGEQALDARFKTKLKTLSNSPKNKVRRSTNRSVFIETPIRDEVESINFEPLFEGYPDYRDLSTNADKILWILAKAKSLGVDKLNQKEITFLSERIGDYINRKSISSAMQRYINEKRLYSTNDGGAKYLKILFDGENYLKQIKK